MRNQRLFLKIYLWFWLATTLVIATQMGLDRLTESGPPFDRVRRTVAVPLAFFSRLALDTYRQDQSPSLPRLTGWFRESTGIDAYWIDRKRDGHDPDLPEHVADAAERAVRSARMQTSHWQDRMVVALPLNAEEPDRFVVVGEASDRPPPPPFMRSPLGAARIVIVMVISGVVCYGLARYLTSPVMALRRATRRFAAGELSVRIGTEIGRRKDEFAELAGDFNHMAEQIGALMALQKQLLADISHELRSPLARLTVALELARRQTGPEAASVLNRIEQEASLINQMVGQLLALRRIEVGVENLEMKPLDLTQVVRQIASDAAFEGIGTNRRIALDESGPCPIVGHADLLRRAIENVVRNAIHHSPENGLVAIRVGRSAPAGAAQAVIEVRDHGPGVPESHLANIFRPFYRASDARERNTGGTGLGLAITAQAVQLHRGRVAAQNAPDGGLIVTIRLPLPGPLP